MAKILESLTEALLHATVDNQQILSSIAKSIQQRQGEQAPELVETNSYLCPANSAHTSQLPSPFPFVYERIVTFTGNGTFLLTTNPLSIYEVESICTGVTAGTYVGYNSNSFFPITLTGSSQTLTVKGNFPLYYSYYGSVIGMVSVLSSGYDARPHPGDDRHKTQSVAYRKSLGIFQG